MVRELVVGTILLGMVGVAGAQMAGSAADAQAEIEAEGRQRLTEYFSKCGDDYFTQEPVFRPPSLVPKEEPKRYKILQFKQVTMRTQLASLSQADALNGVEWKGIISFTATTMRTYEEQAGRPPTMGWTPWKDLSQWDDTWSLFVEKKQGAITPPPPLFAPTRTAVDCASIPPG